MFGDVERNKVHFFGGKMGAGKTVNSVLLIKRFHWEGKPVWCNFPLKAMPPKKRKVEDAGIWFEEDPVKLYAMKGGLYVIDEASLVKNNRDFKNFTKKDLCAFTSVRKLGMTVIVIAQSFAMTDLNIRRVGSTYRQFKGGSLLGQAYPYIEYAIDEQGEIIKGEPVEYQAARPGFSLLSRKTYALYDTDYLFGGDPPRMSWVSAVGWKFGMPATGVELMGSPNLLAPENARIV